MASSELSLEEIREYFLIKGGTVANREVVKHFKKHLTDPATKDDARVKFKKYINTLATTRTDGTEKFLTLRPQYFGPASPSYQSVGIPRPQAVPTSPTYSTKDFLPSSPSSPPTRQPPPYRPPPPVTSSPSISLDNVSMCSSNVSLQDAGTPQAPPRNRSRTSIRSDSQDSFDKKTDKERSAEEDKENVDKKPISVKERTQKFNRLASVEDELSPRQQKERKRNQERGADEDDGASVTSLDQKKCTEWLVTAAKGDYQDLAKLATDEPRLVKLRDPFTTVLHWGAKHGNQDIIKLFAGKHKVDVNAKTNGGYTPLHIAAQMGHKDVYNLLIDVYGADADIRDYSGRKPNQYKRSQNTVANKDTYKIKNRKKSNDKDSSFLRIGSLNVRVKRTTEAFSNFFVGNNSVVNPVDNMNGKVYKSWGSADNLAPEISMPAPKGYVKRKSKKMLDSTGASSTPGTPNQMPRSMSHSHRSSTQDSDSDTAAGFDSNWRP